MKAFCLKGTMQQKEIKEQKMNLTLAQLSISHNIQSNQKRMMAVLESVKENEWVIFPEGMLSGYFPEAPDYLKKIDRDALSEAMKIIKNKVIEKKCHCLFGTVLFDGDKAFNSTIYFGTDQKEFTYRKNNLSTLDRNHFQTGSSLDIFSDDGLDFGIQMCRENAFPEQWKVLKKKGAKIAFHLNHAIQESDAIRKHLLISRAFENQYFVCSVNTFSKTGPLSSLLIAPNGDILYEGPLHQEAISSHEIDLNQVQNTYLEQERRDLVDLEF